MKHVIAASVAFGLVPLLAGCGGSEADSYADRSAARIAQDAKAAMKDAKSFHVEGEGVEDGKTMTLDVSLDRRGHCTGTVAQGDQTVEVRLDGDAFYMKAPGEFWDENAGEGTGEKLAGHWIKAANDGSMDDLCSPSRLVDSFFEEANLENGKVTGTGTVGGTDVVVIKGKDSDGKESTVSVAAEAPHHVLRVEGAELRAEFSDFDEAVEVNVPEDAIDIANGQS